MSENQSASAQAQAPQRHRVEGPQKHIIAFILSLALTIIAFAAVASGISATFTYVILILMAVIQVLVQLSFWMHLKDKGHLFPIISICAGVVLVIAMVVMAVYWVWW